MYLPNYNMPKTKRRRVVVPKQKLTEYEEFKKDEPEMPDFTCPHIDNVVDWLYKAGEEMELLRTMNSKLRDNVEYWKSSCEEMQYKLDEMREWKKNLQNIVNQDI
jgi:hypothetical protein